jgi:hypothetical protein
MSVFLIATSFVTTVLIPRKEFQVGGEANGRALAFLAHEYQGGAYATGVLVLITSAALAVMLAAPRRRQRIATVGYGVITAVFCYTTVVNVIARPDGVKIASFFIIANEPDARDEREYLDKEREQREDNHIPADDPVLFLEVTIGDSSDFTTELSIRGEERFGYKILRVNSPTVPNAIAAILLRIRDETGVVPHVYFAWAEGNPFRFLFHYLFSGAGDVPPVTREVLRRAEPEPQRRPAVHVG